MMGMNERSRTARKAERKRERDRMNIRAQKMKQKLTLQPELNKAYELNENYV